MVNSNSESCDSKTIRQKTFALLKENNRLSPKRICAELHLPYVHYGGYINNLKSYWNSHHQNELGSRCSSVHNWRGWCLVPIYVDREIASSVGWRITKAKNRWLLWEDNLGRLEWFENGRVNIWAKSPVSLGRIKQLICNGFSFTGLIFEDKVLDQVLATIHPSGAHYVFEIGHSLPKKTISYFEKSHGLTIKIGDKSHPTSVEVISNIPDWVEKFEEYLGKLDGTLTHNVSERSFLKPDYVV